MPGPDAGPAALNGLGLVRLPLAGLSIWQDTRAQAVSNAASALQAAALAEVDERPLRVLELGSGCGIVSLMLALQRPLWTVDALEIQERLHELALLNNARCGASVSFFHADLRGWTSHPGYQLIVANPPWQKPGGGKTSPHPQKNLSRRGTFCSPAELAACLQGNLASDGIALVLFPRGAMFSHFEAALANSLLDIKSASDVTDLRDQSLFKIGHKGIAR